MHLQHCLRLLRPADQPRPPWRWRAMPRRRTGTERDLAGLHGFSTSLVSLHVDKVELVVRSNSQSWPADRGVGNHSPAWHGLVAPMRVGGCGVGVRHAACFVAAGVRTPERRFNVHARAQLRRWKAHCPLSRGSRKGKEWKSRCERGNRSLPWSLFLCLARTVHEALRAMSPNAKRLATSRRDESIASGGSSNGADTELL